MSRNRIHIRHFCHRIERVEILDYLNCTAISKRFFILGYYCKFGKVDWYPFGDAEASNHFPTEEEAVDYAIDILKVQIRIWEGLD